MKSQLKKEWTEYFDSEGKDPKKLLTLLWEQNKEVIEEKIRGGGFPIQPQRTWVGLTDEETAELVHRYAFYELTRQIEAKLKAKNERLEKNTRNGGCL